VEQVDITDRKREPKQQNGEKRNKILKKKKTTDKGRREKKNVLVEAIVVPINEVTNRASILA
jgi:hypothetical protein